MRRIIFSELQKWTVRFAEGIVVITSLIVLSAICLQIILRYVFRQPLLGLEEIALMVVLWLWFFGMASASERGFHISGGLPVTRQSIQNIMKVAYPFISFIVSLVFCYLAYNYCQFVLKEDIRSVALRIPWIYCVLGVFLGLALNTAYLIRETVVKLRVFRQAGQGESK